MLYDDQPGDCLIWKRQGQSIEAIMQFTGFCDVRGKEIYEGDLVRYYPCVCETKIWEVFWGDNGAWMVRQNGQTTTLYYYAPDHVEVVGNIYENPELLTTYSQDDA